MALFCGRINLAMREDEAAATDGMVPMLLEFSGKGTGSITSNWHDGMAIATKPLTRDCITDAKRHFASSAEIGVAVGGSIRIDNQQEIAGRLGLDSGQLARTTDADLVLYAYARWGKESIRHLYGDFAFVLWDTRSRSVWCARDSAGAIPFYFARSGDLFVFGNDLSAVAAAKEVPDELDARTTASYLDVNLIMPPGKTLHSHCQRLRPGYELNIDQAKSEERDWWQPRHVPDIRFARDEDYVEALAERLGKAVADRARGVSLTGAHVSGGLDSSTVTAILLNARAAANAAPPLALTWNPLPATEAESQHPEAAMLQAFCNHIGLSPRRHPPDASCVLEFFSRDPVRHPPSNMLIMEIAIQRAAAEAGVGTLFSGHGGDQCLSYGGGNVHSDLLVMGRWKQLLREARLQGKNPAALVLRGKRNHLRQAINSRWPFCLSGPVNEFRNPSVARWVPHRKFKPDFTVTVAGRQRDMLASGYTDMRMDAWAEAGSRRALRYAYPLLDRSVTEFALGLPPEMFSRHGENRWIMRNLARRYLPEDVRQNASKTEPTRSRAMVAAIESARPELVRMLENVDPASPRAQLVNVPRLLADLRANPIRPRGDKAPGFHHRQKALEVLDLAPTDQ